MYFTQGRTLEGWEKWRYCPHSAGIYIYIVFKNKNHSVHFYIVCKIFVFFIYVLLRMGFYKYFI